MSQQTILATIPGSIAGERVQIVLHHVAGEGSYMELQQQSHGGGVGWFTQSSVRLEPHQVAELRLALGRAGKMAHPAPRPAFRQAEEPSTVRFPRPVAEIA